MQHHMIKRGQDYHIVEGLDLIMEDNEETPEQGTSGTTQPPNLTQQVEENATYVVNLLYFIPGLWDLERQPPPFKKRRREGDEKDERFPEQVNMDESENEQVTVTRLQPSMSGQRKKDKPMDKYKARNQPPLFKDLSERKKVNCEYAKTN